MRKFILFFAMAALMITGCHGVRPGADEEAVLVHKPWFFGYIHRHIHTLRTLQGLSRLVDISVVCLFR